MKWEMFVEAIEDALDKECFLPALALTLVLPDICSEYEYPTIYKKKDEYNGHKGQGAAYAKWYDEYIYKYELCDFSKSNLDVLRNFKKGLLLLENIVGNYVVVYCIMAHWTLMIFGVIKIIKNL